MTTTPRTAPGLAGPRSRPSAASPGPRCRDTRTSRATTGLTRPGGRRATVGQGLDSWRES